ncbi:MAG: protease HtpX [Bdellovibrionales bacterium]|nr:protease HtpX [Bdellovibrionales bacterium]
MFKGLAKGLLLLIITNIVIMVTFAVAMSVLQAFGIVPEGFVGYSAVSALVWGFGGAFLSLAMSRWVAKTFLGVKVIDPKSVSEYTWVVEMVHQQAKAAGLPKMPEVGIYESPELNAFATGPSKSRALVAFSSGLLRAMPREAVEGVSAHEVTHISNGDMLAMTLLQGLVNAFAIFFARIIGREVASRISDNSAVQMAAYYVIYIAAQILFMLLGSLIIAWFSRKREFRADAGSAKIAGTNKMIAALEYLKQGANMEIPDEQRIPEGAAALGISERGHSWMKAFATHPPLEARIEALRTHQR